jgi:uncharacterized membrane protein YjjB (DUF3815 family)
MDLPAIVMNSLWAGLLAGGLAILFTAPLQYVPATLLCGFAGRCVRDVFIAWGLNQNGSIVIAAVVVVLVAVVMTRGHAVSPIMLAAGVIPLGAAMAMFRAIFELLKISSLSGEALNASSVALTENIGEVFTTSLAISLGLGIGMAVVRILRHKEVLSV